MLKIKIVMIVYTNDFILPHLPFMFCVREINFISIYEGNKIFNIIIFAKESFLSNAY